MSNHPLSEDLVRDILSRLSVKMLSRCKLVCKKWRALIQCPDFVKQHFNHESNRARVLMRRTSFVVADNMIGNKYLLNVDETFSKFEEPPHLQMPFTYLIGPLNGIYWVVTDTWPVGPAGLLNPATRQFKPLPLFEHKESQERKRRGRLLVEDFDFGLGLDPVTGDFKLVVMSFCMKFAAVCTSDNEYESWRFLDGVKPRCKVLNGAKPGCKVYNYGSSNTYLKGVYYWLIDCYQSGDVLVSTFDMSTEELNEIQVVSCDVKWGWGLLALNGDSLVLVMEGVDKTSVSVWTMLKEGCWIRSAMMVLPEISIWPLYFWKNDELLLKAWESVWGGNEYLITYNVSSKELGVPLVARRTENARFYSYLKYEESLVSLKGKRGNYMLWDPTCSDYIKNFYK